MSDIQDAFDAAFPDYADPTMPAAGPAKPLKSRVRAIGAAIEGRIGVVEAGQNAALISAKTWTALSGFSTVGRAVGDTAEVVGPDAGAHTDPVVGGDPVANEGRYRWSPSPAGWERIGEALGARVQEAIDAAEAATAAAVDVVNPSTVTRRYGPLALGTSDADFAANFSWLLWQATERTTIKEIGLTVAGVGNGQVSVIVATGDPEDGNMTFVSATPLSAVASTGVKTWVSPDLPVIQPGQWVGLSFPPGGPTVRRRSGRAYYRVPVLTSGTGAFSVAVGLDAYFDTEEPAYAVEKSALSPEIQEALSVATASAETLTKWTGYPNALDVETTGYTAESVVAIDVAKYAGDLTGVKFRVNAAGNGKANVMVMRGPIAGRPTVIYECELPSVSVGEASFVVGDDFDPVFLREGDIVCIVSQAGGPTLGTIETSAADTVYAINGYNPYVGNRVVFAATVGRVAAGRFSQTVRTLNVPPQSVPLEWDIFLLCGQSNMVGKAPFGETPIKPGIAKQWYSGALTDLTADPVGAADKGSMCPAIAAEHYRLTGKGIIFVPAAVLGSGLQSVAGGGVSNTWSAAAGTGGSAYRVAAKNLLNAAKAAAKAAGLAHRVAGIMICQGEADADAIAAGTPGASGAGYVTEFGNFVSYFQTELGYASGKLIFLIVRTGTRREDDAPYKAAYQEIRDAQDTCARTYPGVYMAFTGAVNFAARGLLVDTWHWNHTALNEAGTAVARVAASVCAGRA